MKLNLLEAEFSNNDFGAIEEKSMSELRAWRERCLNIESQLSLIRRLVHGQIDILEAKSTEDGAGISNLLRIVPELFSDASSSRSRRRVARVVEISEPDSGLEEELSDAVGGMELGHILALSETERAEVTRSLVALEVRVSALRRTMQTIVDSIQSEVGIRYRDGNVSFPAGSLT